MSAAVLGSCPPGVPLGAPNTMQPTSGDIIRLMDSTGKNVLDSVACECEDSFSLESFGDLAAAHETATPIHKQLIIARVQTWDLNNPDRAYYSYYNAFHLNRALFQTQIYLGKKLIHRMHVLNPLTNTDIIGHVLYFAVVSPATGSATATATAPLKTGETAAPSPTVAAAEAGLPAHWTLGTQAVAAVTEDYEFLLLSAATPSPSVSSSPPVTGAPSPPSARWSMSPPPAPAPRGRARLVDSARRLSVATSAATRRMVQHPLSIFSPRQNNKDDDKDAATATQQQIQTQAGKRQTIIRLSPSTSNAATTIDPTMTSSVLADLPVGASKVPAQPLILNNIHRGRVPAPSGIITRFAIPAETETRAAGPAVVQRPPNSSNKTGLSAGRPESGSGDVFIDAKEFDIDGGRGDTTEGKREAEAGEGLDEVRKGGHRDSLAGGGGGEHSTMRERYQTIPASKQSHLPLHPSGVVGDQGARPPAAMRLLKQPMRQSGSSKAMAMATATITKTSARYDALLIATDTDYLESSSVRARFRLNAYAPGDSRLFELPEYKGESSGGSGEGESPIIGVVSPISRRGGGGNEPLVLMVDRGGFCGCCFPNAKPGSLAARALFTLQRMQMRIILATLCFTAIVCVIIMAMRK